ncbi:MAG: alpha/beta fold hydrolase [Gemmataceae bacterium]|nr:alpha/beta fold hydrolase [Gemmataceae bacterium]
MMISRHRQARALAAWFLVVPAAATPLDQPAVKDIAGLWFGTLKTGVVELRLAFRIVKSGDGWSGTMDSLDQGAKDIPLSAIEFKDGKVRLELKTIKAEFEGTLEKDGAALVGRWKQAGDLPLTLQRVDKVPEIARPQHPKKPYPYLEIDVTIDSLQQGIKLAGTLTLPRGPGPFPAVVLLSGSGPQDRDETIFNHKPFLVLADHLTRHGIAVLRLDDRGVGGSTGNVLTATLEDCAQDVLACLQFLKGRKEINARKLGLIGHSEGGILAPYVAAKSDDVAFVVLLAGTGLPGEELLYLQGQALLKANGAGAEVMRRQRLVQELMFQALKEEKDNDKAKKLIRQRLDDFVKKLSVVEQAVYKAQEKSLEAQLQTITTPWFRFFLTYDPRPTLAKLRVPVLALIGEKDVQVPPKENLAAIRQALAQGGNKDVTLQELPNLNHLFQTAKTGSVAEYARIEETFAPSALALISDWIVQRSK